LQNKKIQNAWAFYDWANSVYPLVITTAIFPIFYEEITDETISFFGYSFVNTSLVSFVSAISFLIVCFLIPMLSGIADYLGNKKSFMRFFCYLGSVSCCLLYFFNTDSIELGMLTFMFASIGFWSSLVFYNAYLPEIAKVSERDKLSAFGFSLGYFGSSILLIISLVLITYEIIDVKVVFLLTGLWWFSFSHITYKYLPSNPKKSQKLENTSYIWNGFKELKLVYNKVKKTKRLKRYLLAFFIYSMAVQTIMLMAVYFGKKEIYWGIENSPEAKEAARTGLIISVLAIQFVAIAGATILSWLSGKIGNISSLIVVLCMWILICISAIWVTLPIHFYIIAGAVGLVMGGIQSVSRSTYAKFIPETKDSASYFSYYDVAEKLGIVVGMLSYGIIEQLTGSMRSSIVMLTSFFILALFLLLRVPKEEVNHLHIS